MITFSDVQELVSRWWFSYDEGQFDQLAEMLTEDVHFTVRTDTGKTEYEEFVTADVRGKSDVMAWQTEHRLDSPYPLRHNGANLHLTEISGEDALFASYIFVTHIVDGLVLNLSSGVVTGTVRADGASPKLASLNVILDTEPSRTLREVRAAGLAA